MAMRPAKQTPNWATIVVSSVEGSLIYGTLESIPTYIALFAYIVIQNTDVRTQSRSAINSSRFMNRYLDSIRNDGLRGQRLIIHQAQSQA
jgi:hypothetical protein